jgi:cell division protein FtsQ
MRLLPNHLRVAVIERTPVAFVRQGNHIGLVDANGVLLDMPTDVQANMHYSFPVIIGLAQTDPLSLRAARMKLYARYISDLNSSGEKISEKLSEVDLSDPEDVRSIVADKGGEVMVHFGEDNFLDRYRRFEEHLAEWRTQYPHLSSVDMRYERQVVLEMQKGSTTPMPAAEAIAPVTEPPSGQHPKPVAASASNMPTTTSAAPTKQALSKAKTTGAKKSAAAKTTSGATQHQQRPTRANGESFWVHPKQATAGRATTEPAKGTTPAEQITEPQQSHPPQVIHR